MSSKADFNLVVGAEISASYEEMRKDLKVIINTLNKQPYKIKLGLDMASWDKEVSKIKSDINEVRKSLTDKAGGTPKTSSSSSGGSKSSSSAKYDYSAIQKYYSLLYEVEKKETDIINQDGRYVSVSGKWDKYAASLNNAKAKLDNLTSEEAKSKMSKEELLNLTTRLSAAEEEYGLKVEALQNKQANAQATKEAAQAEREYAAAKRQANAEEKAAAQETKIAEATARNYTNAISQGESALKRYSAAERSRHQESRVAYQNLANSLENLKATEAQYGRGSKEVAAATASFKSTLKETQAVLISNGDATQSFTSKLGGLAKKFGSWLTVSQAIMYAVRSVRRMISTAIEIDSAFTQLKIVTGATNDEMKEFGATAISLAKDLGKSVTETTSAIETFSRLGYTLQEATSLSKYSSILSNVAGVSSEEATTGLTSIVKGFNLKVDDAEHISDILINVGQKYAVSAGEMMEAYEKSSAALSATNTSLEKSAGLIAAANASVQDASVVGTALKTVSARIRGSKSDLEELGESTEGLAEGFSKYADEIKALTGFDIMIDDTHFKDLYDIMEGIAGVWKNLSDTQQARVAEILGGTRQLQVISSIIGNWKDAAGAYDTAMKSVGVSTEANAIYMDSMQAHVNQLKATFEEFSTDVVNSEFAKGFVDTLKNVLSLLDGIVDKFGVLPTMLASIGGYLAFKNIGVLKQLPSYLKGLNDIGVAIKALNKIDVGVVGVNYGNITAYQEAIKGLSAEQAVAALSSKKLTAQQIKEIMTTESAVLATNTYTEADIQAALAKNGLSTSTSVLTAAQQAEIVNSGVLTTEKLAEVAATLGLVTAEDGSLVSKQALNLEMVKQQLTSIGVVGVQQEQILTMLGLTAAEGAAVGATNLLTGAFNALKASMASNPIGWIITAVVVLIALLQKLKSSMPSTENTSKWLEESSSEVNGLQDDIKNLNEELTTTREKIDELSKKPSLTLVEQNELDRLKKTNAELERKIHLRERELQVSQRKNSKNFVNATEATRNTKDDKDLWNNDSTAIAIMARQYVDMGTESYDAESFFDKVLEAYKNAEAAKANATEEELKNIDEYQNKASEWMSEYVTKLQKNLDDLGDFDYETLSDEAKAQVDYINDTLNTYDKLLGNDETVFSNIYNQERFSKAKQSIENLKKTGQLTAEALASLYNKDANVKAMIDNMVKVGLINDTTANSFALLTNQILDTGDAANNTANKIKDVFSFTIDTKELETQINELKENIDSIASAYSDIIDIIDDYNENGNLTLDNLESLISLGDDYIGTLFNENGELELNKNSYIALAKAKLEDIRYSMLEKAISQINSLKKNEETSANQTLAESTGNLTEETLKLVAAQKLSEGVDASKIQSIMQTYYQWDALIDNVVTGLEENADVTLGAADAADEVTDSTNSYKDALEDEKDALEDAKDALEDQKDALEDMKNGYEDAISSIKDLIDWVQDYIKQIKNDEIDALQKKKDSIDELIDAQKELIEAEKEEYEWNKKISEKQNAVAKDALAASIASLDDSSAGRKAQKQANDKLAESRADMYDTLYDHEVEIRKNALDELKEQEDEYYDNLIQNIQDYLNNEVQLYKDACAMIDNDSGDLYGKLLWYCQTYTTTTEAEFNHMWNSAQSAMEQYNTANIGTFELLNNLQGRIYDVDNAINTVEQSISGYESAISGLQTQIDNLGDTAEDTIKKIANLTAEKVKLNGNWYVEYNGEKYSSFFDNKNDAINDLRRQVTRDVPFNELNPLLINNSTVKHYASGTNSAAGGLSLVGERGAELRVLNPGDGILKNQIVRGLTSLGTNPAQFIADAGKKLLSSLFGNSIKPSFSAIGSGNNQPINIVNNIQGDVNPSTLKALVAAQKKIVQDAVKEMQIKSLSLRATNRI